jgi:hypothetical protein
VFWLGHSEAPTDPLEERRPVYDDGWPRERRVVPDGVKGEATKHPGRTVFEIDGSLVVDPSAYVPREAIIGVFLVGHDGVATGDFLRNPDHGPVQDDFEQLTLRDVWLDWLPGAPLAAVRGQIEDMLSGQVTGSRVDWLKIIDEPDFLTTWVGSETGGVVRRAGLALLFALSVTAPSGGPWIHTGAFSWVAAHLDEPARRRDRTWLDLGSSRVEAGEALKVRIYELDDEV